MVTNLLVGLPGQRPGGLVLTLLLAAVAATVALVAGLGYAVVAVAFPRASLPLQATSAALRGVPLLMLLLLLSQMATLSLVAAGLVALVLYSFAHVAEILRSFLAAYPSHLADQGRVTGLGVVRELLLLRVPWTLGRALDALATHWISLLKDTGALVVLGVAELTTVAKVLSQSSASLHQWTLVLGVAAGLYLAATLGLIQGLKGVRSLPFAAGVPTGLAGDQPRRRPAHLTKGGPS